MAKMEVGDKLPQFKVKDHKGFTLTDEDIRGTATVIYFYPKDQTPGCTQEACDFQESLKKFDEQQVLLLGVSPDSVDSHKKFLEKNKLHFTLLSDESKEMCQSFGVLSEGKIERSTFLIDHQGIIRWIERPVKVDGHTERVLEAVHQFCPSPLKHFKTLNQEYAEFIRDALHLKKKKHD